MTIMTPPDRVQSTMTIRAKPTSSRALLLIPVPLALLCIFYLPSFLSLSDPARASTTPYSSSSTDTPPRGQISDLFHAQHLSHGAFHNRLTKKYLANLVSRHHPYPKAAVIIGLAYGGEADMLAEYDVHAIEPMPHFVENFRKKDAAHVTLHPFAAAKESGVMTVSYKGDTVSVNKTRGDAVIPKGFSPAVVSADTQGSEFDALLGLGDIMTRTGSVWVELGCQDSTEEMLRWLDERFVLFDFIPWGKKTGVKGEFAEQQFATGPRPSEIKEWVEWFCIRKDEFEWLQTDVVGVSRELVRQCWVGLQDMAKECCQDDECKLRDLVVQH